MPIHGHLSHENVHFLEGQERRGSPGREGMVSTSQRGEQGTNIVSSPGRRPRDEGADLRMGTRSNCGLHSFLRVGVQGYSL